MRATVTFLIALLCASAATAEQPASTCYGETSKGSLENGWKLPSDGPNFTAYSSIGVMAGRTYVHSRVYQVLVDSYAALEKTAAGKHFVYGESGLESGGAFRPHKTHQNGLSVDFFVPVLNAQGDSVSLPIGVFNKLGYNIEFDGKGQFETLQIDFESMAKHLLEIKRAADKHGVGIRVVIFDNAYQKKLIATATGKTLPAKIRFSVKKPWVRHDEHYHVDFVVKCAKQR